MVAGALVAVLVLLVAALGFGVWRWRRATAALVERLQAAARPLPAAHVDLREVDDLPATVQRYLRAVLTDGAPVVRGASLTHRGSFNMASDPNAPQWKPFASRQVVVVQRPGFVWDGRITMLPGVAAHVHDAYVAGQGLLHAAAAGLITLADLRGTADLAEGELMRFLAEATWYPTALLPSQGVQWSPVDANAAQATLRDGNAEVTLDFVFGDDGLVRAVRTAARGRTVGGRSVPTPWEGRWSNYQWRDGMRVPIDGEVAWLLPEGELPYWRGTITALEYQKAR